MAYIDNDPTEEDISEIVFPAREAVARTLDLMETRQRDVTEGKSIHEVLGVPAIDKALGGFWPSDLIFVSALPGNGKSFLLRRMAMVIMKTLINYQDRNMEKNPSAIVWISVEESVEQVFAFLLASLAGVSATEVLSGMATEKVVKAVNEHTQVVSSWPFIIVGRTVARRDKQGRRKRQKRLGIQGINQAINYIVNDLGIDPAIILMDYLQQIEIEPGITMKEHIDLCVNMLRDLGFFCACPVVCATQSKTSVADYRWPLARLTDSEWSAKAGQAADKFLSAWLVKTSVPVGEMLKGPTGEIVVTPNDFFTMIAKNKNGPAGDVFHLWAEPQKVGLKEAPKQQSHFGPARQYKDDDQFDFSDLAV